MADMAKRLEKLKKKVFSLKKVVSVFFYIFVKRQYKSCEVWFLLQLVLCGVVQIYAKKLTNQLLFHFLMTEHAGND